MTVGNTHKSVLVYAHWSAFNEPIFIGVLHADIVRGKEVFSFEYDKEWLESGHAQNLDPDLQLYAAPQYLPESKNNFGIFMDSSPDRWGRTLMDRREAHAINPNCNTQTFLIGSFMIPMNNTASTRWANASQSVP